MHQCERQLDGDVTGNHDNETLAASGRRVCVRVCVCVYLMVRSPRSLKSTESEEGERFMAAEDLYHRLLG